MSDVFISYSRDDRDRAETFADAIRRRGFTVWWDRKIPPGKTFDEVIQEALTETHCVVVLWSESSVKSDFVKDEAQRAADKGNLIPIRLDEVPIPLGFGRIQTADLVGWRQDQFHDQFEYVIESIATFAGRQVAPEERTGFRVKLQEPISADATGDSGPAEAPAQRLEPRPPAVERRPAARPKPFGRRCAVVAALILAAAVTGVSWAFRAPSPVVTPPPVVEVHKCGPICRANQLRERLRGALNRSR